MRDRRRFLLAIAPAEKNGGSGLGVGRRDRGQTRQTPTPRRRLNQFPAARCMHAHRASPAAIATPNSAIAATPFRLAEGVRSGALGGGSRVLEGLRPSQHAFARLAARHFARLRLCVTLGMTSALHARFVAHGEKSCPESRRPVLVSGNRETYVGHQRPNLVTGAVG